MQQEEKIDLASAVVVARREREERELREREARENKGPIISRSPMALTTSPRKGGGGGEPKILCVSSSNLTVGFDLPTKPCEFTLSNTNLRARSPLDTVGRRLSHGDGGSPPLPSLSSSSHLSGSGNNLMVRPVVVAPPQQPTTTTTTTAIKRSTTESNDRRISSNKDNNNGSSGSNKGFATLRPPRSSGPCRSPLLSPPDSNELTLTIGRRLSREWSSGNLTLMAVSQGDLSSRGEQCSFLVPPPLPDAMPRRETCPALEMTTQQPIRRARSHETKELRQTEVEPAPQRLVTGVMHQPVPVVGGSQVSQRTKKQLESELKAILTARQHHQDLQHPHPP